MIECPDCEGDGCKECDDDGEVEVASCPKKLIGNSVYEAMMAADMAKKGCWPVAGGWLDQTHTCIESVQRIWSEEAKCKAGTGGDSDDG